MKMKVVQFTMQEIWAASRHTVQKNKKKYVRKEKHNKKDSDKGPYLVYQAYKMRFRIFKVSIIKTSGIMIKIILMGLALIGWVVLGVKIIRNLLKNNCEMCCK